MRSTNFEKFRLLLWKNWTLQWNHKLQFLYEVFAPMFVSLLLVALRLLVKSSPVEAVRYNTSFEMNDFSLLSQNYDKYVPRLGYSPTACEFCRQIMTEVGARTLVKIYAAHNSNNLELKINERLLIAGVDFGDINGNAVSYPKKLSFSIRFPSELRTSPLVLETWNTNKLYLPLDPSGPRNRLVEDGGTPAGYLREGFLTIQNQVSLAYIKLASSRPQTIPAIKIKRFPYPSYIEDPLLYRLSTVMALIIMLCYVKPVIYTVKSVALEKEKQLKEVLKIMGLSNWLHWAAWFVKSFTVVFLSTILVTYVLTTNWSNNVAVLMGTPFSSILFFLSVYATASITFCFMMATFFNKASTAAAVTGLYWFTSFFPYAYISMNYDSVSPSTKLLWCVLANTSLGLGIRIIAEWELTGQGMGWDKFFQQSSASDPLKMIHIINMMLAMAAVHMLVCLYVEQVRPGAYGVPKPWIFPIQKSFWFGEAKRSISRDSTHEAEWDPSNYESEPLDKAEGVVISNLSKWYGDKQAVKNLSFSMYVNEITVLLGHNGAGKTTTISMLIGMIPPTSGTAYIMDCDIRTDMNGAREFLSICPQHNVLFDELTVRDHLKFFAHLRGLRGTQLEDEVESYLEKTDLKTKADIMSVELSGGMQRKLSVCCAFCGGPSVVFCDEPSSGMDPTARRQLWNILQREKEGRVILLTTHFMDEADVLADRVAIMAMGQLKCYGTSFFLKKKFGRGYTLICVKETNCASSEVTEFLRKSIPDLEVNEETDTEIFYILQEQYSPLFSQMLSDFEEAMKDFKISGFGLSHTSLEDVFMQTGAEIFARDTNEGDFNSVAALFSEAQRLTGFRLRCSRFQSMILKKYLNFRRNGVLAVIQFMMIVSFVVLSVVVRATELYTCQDPMTIKLEQYEGPKVVLDVPRAPSGALKDIISNLKNIASNVIDTNEVSFEEFILSQPPRGQHLVDKMYIAGYTLTENQYLIWLNNKPVHSAPLALNLLHNAIARSILGPEAEITVTNHPLPFNELTQIYLAGTGLGLGTQLSVNVGFSMSLISASFCLFIIRERQSKAKLLQFVSGVGGGTFWLTHFLWDFCYLSILALVFMLTLATFEEEGYTYFDELARNFAVFLSFAFSVLPLTYLMSRRYAEPANGFARLSMCNLLLGVGLFTIDFILSFEILKLTHVEYELQTYALIVPHFALAKALHTLYINHKLHKVCEPLMSLDDFRRCKFFTRCCEIVPYFAWQGPGIGRPILYLLLSGTFYCFVVASIHYRLTGAIWDKYAARQSSKKYIVPKPKVTDSDVEQERSLIDQMTRKDILQYKLVMKRLTKFYCDFLAVNQISVAIKESECFGLLGLNGAGKSTTFKMLTQDEKATFGTAYVKGLNIQTETKAVYNEIGYCPQFGGLFLDFTGRETLRLFAMIHGVPTSRTAQVSESLARTFGFMKHYDKLVRNYSGGNRRKLSTAVAVIGGPSVVLLDEPTSGMDPGSRRRLWNAIRCMRKAGTSIVLTSHCMDECVALCTRMGIMVNGELRCLGSIQHLRIKYSQGLILKVKVTSARYPRMSRPSIGYRESLNTATDVRERAVELWVQRQFPDAELIDNFQGLLSFNIPMAENLWSKLFAEMEFVKDALFIEDYSISQTDLEDIFLYFNKH